MEEIEVLGGFDCEFIDYLMRCTEERTGFRGATHAVRYILPVLGSKERLEQRAIDARNFAY